MSFCDLLRSSRGVSSSTPAWWPAVASWAARWPSCPPETRSQSTSSGHRAHLDTRGHITSSHKAQKPNSWTYNFIEVSGRNLESSLTSGFCMDFLNQREGGIVFCIRVSSFLLYRNCKRLRDLKKLKSQGKSVNKRRKTLKTFVWISSKNSVSGHWSYRQGQWHSAA